VARFIARRLVGMIFVLFAISVIVFLIFNVIPNGSPALRICGKNCNAALLHQIKIDFGFNDPIYVQYWTMMKQIFTGTLVSYNSQLNVLDQIKQGIPITFSLCIGAVFIWMTFAVFLGYVSAIKPGSFRDRAITVVTAIGISMPSFFLGALLLYYLTSKSSIFPPGGYVGFLSNPLDWAYHLILPWFTLAFLFIGIYCRLLRSNMLDVMNEDYVRTARAKGLTERQVRIRHVLRNSMVPIVTLFGLDVGALVGGGAIIIEFVYNLPGVGDYAATSISNLDLPPIMAITLFGAFFIVLFNAFVDVAYAYLDPRVRLGESAEGAV
jgi:peptide/nickel transport system permease protein